MEQQESERRWVRQALECLGYRPEGLRSSCPDPPDVEVAIDDRLIGIEVVEYHRDRPTVGESRLRKQQADISRIQAVFEKALESIPNLNVDGCVYFKESANRVSGASPGSYRVLPGGRQIKDFVEQLLCFAIQKKAELNKLSGDEYATFSAPDFRLDFPIILECVDTIELRLRPYTDAWNFDPEADSYGLCADVWVTTINKKAEVIRKAKEHGGDRFSRYHEVWLLISGGCPKAQSMSVTRDFFEKEPAINKAVQESGFAKVMIFDSLKGNIWEWCGERWRHLRHTTTQGKIDA